jgi:hypothetical protein
MRWGGGRGCYAGSEIFDWAFFENDLKPVLYIYIYSILGGTPTDSKDRSDTLLSVTLHTTRLSAIAACTVSLIRH